MRANAFSEEPPTMFCTASTLVLTIALSAAAGDPTAAALIDAPAADAVVTTSITATTPGRPDVPVNDISPETPLWMSDRSARPAALPAMYATLGALQALDVYSTRRALRAGATELNPAMRAASGNAGAMLAVKALSTARAIFFTERAWKKNRKGAVILMAIVNGVTTAVVASNLKNGR